MYPPAPTSTQVRWSGFYLRDYFLLVRPVLCDHTVGSVPDSVTWLFSHEDTAAFLLVESLGYGFWVTVA